MRAVRRLLVFAAKRVFALVIVVSLLMASFYLALNTATIWIMVDDGLEARAACIIRGEDGAILSKYFTRDFLKQDAALQIGLSDASPYRDYIIRSFTHKVQVRSIWAWPWENVGRAEIVESVPSINGTIQPALREAAAQAGGEARLSPPAWETGRYRVTLVRTQGRWLISNLQQLSGTGG